MYSLGTPHFWSIEVKHSRPLYVLGAKSKPVFWHDVLHNLELIFWVSIWTMLWLVGGDEREQGRFNSSLMKLYNAIYPEGTAMAMKAVHLTFLGIPNIRVYLPFEYPGAIICSKELQSLLKTYHFKLLPELIVKGFKDSESVFPAEASIPYENTAFTKMLRAVGNVIDELDQKIDSQLGYSPVQAMHMYKV